MKFNNPYHAFPLEMHGNYAKIEEAGRTRFFEIHATEYSTEKIADLARRNILKESTLGKYLHHISIPRSQEESVYFLYKLSTYYADISIRDHWLFNESTKDYCDYYFYNIDDLLTFIKNKWNIEINDFSSSAEIGLPF